MANELYAAIGKLEKDKEAVEQRLEKLYLLTRRLLVNAFSLPQSNVPGCINVDRSDFLVTQEVIAEITALRNAKEKNAGAPL